MMRASFVARAKAALILLLLGLDLILANVLSPQDAVSTQWVILAFAPITLILLDVLWHQWGRIPALLVATSIVLAGLFLLPHLKSEISLIYLAQHLTANLLLGFWFGGSLWRHRNPVCTQFAGLLHPRMTPLLRHYTRRVTQAWTIFFFAMAATSLLLYLFAPIMIWSVFANALTLPLLVLMFAAEYLVRLRAIPADERVGPVEAFRAYMRYNRERRGTTGASDSPPWSIARQR